MNYSEIFCESTKIIAEGILNGISYDKTIICTILDDSNRQQGEYLVSDGATKFKAYSQDQTYYNGTVVYVTIPEGNYSNTKIIVGKQIDNSTLEPFIYTAPFKNFLDVSDNLYSGIKSDGLVANDLTEDGNEKLLFRNSYSEGYNNFTRFGVKAEFKSWLKEMDCIVGEYGLKINLIFYGDFLTNESDKDTEKLYSKTLYLNTKDMIGNPYAFDSFFEQEKVFDISTFGSLKGIEVYFYQIPNSFKDSNGQLIPYQNKDFDGEISTLLSNLFVQNIELYVGYDLSDYSSDFVQIYSFNSLTYVNTKPNDIKTISLKWVHFDENGNRLKMEDHTNKDFEIRWYQYELGAPSADAYSGVYWKAVNVDEENKKKFSYNFQPDMYKKETEQIKAIVFYEDKVYPSNIITFSNNKQVSNQATIDAMKALTLRCRDVIGETRYDSYGNYFIYDQSNNLIDFSESSKERIIECYFKLESSNEEGWNSLADNDSITWQIPIKNTMINYRGEIPTEQKDNNNVTVTWLKEDIEENLKRGFEPHISYEIKSYYSATYSNNTIICTVIKNGITYSTSKELSFGQAGTSGTDYTFVLDFDNQTVATLGKIEEIPITARLYDAKNKEVDLTGKTINWSWFKVKDETSAGIVISDNKGTQAKLSVTKELVDFRRIYILQATLTDWGDYELTAYLPIPIRKDENLLSLTGATQLIYLTDGSIRYYQNGYKLWDKNGLEVSNLKWVDYCPDVADSASDSSNDKKKKQQLKKYLPEIYYNTQSQEYHLRPVSLFIDGLPPFAINAYQVTKVGDNITEEIIWSQPILIIQNRYFSSTINKWNGKQLEIGDNYVLGKMLGAGRKEKDDNSFSGVLLGDLADEAQADIDSISGKTGIYGFRKGVMSYSFTDDGKATIGTATGSQLIFDGTESTITSGDFKSSKTGLKIDFNDGSITSQVNGTTIFKIDNSDPYLKISTLPTEDENGEEILSENLMYVGKNNYYLRSLNFSSGNDGIKGMYINLSDGVIISDGAEFHNMTANGGTFNKITANGGTFNNIAATGGTFSEVDVTGTITATNITANTGTIAGWTIDSTGLKGTAAQKDSILQIDHSTGSIWFGDNKIFIKTLANQPSGSPGVASDWTVGGIGIKGKQAASLEADKIYIGNTGAGITIKDSKITFRGNVDFTTDWNAANVSSTNLYALLG